jgi:invasion protein IalB
VGLYLGCHSPNGAASGSADSLAARFDSTIIDSHFFIGETMRTTKTTAALATVLLTASITANAQEFQAGEPLNAVNEAGVKMPMSANVKVYGSFDFSESCTFDPAKNLILAMNAGDRTEGAPEDGFVSLINPDGSVHTAKWIGATRDGLTLADPIGSAVRNGVLYTVDSGNLRSFDLATGRPTDRFRSSPKARRSRRRTAWQSTTTAISLS